ncbi:thiamine-phosphate diphosphorylase [Planococcus donghaensis]|uniref:Thiamine-phosphate synthase n=2 Tax=Planococcus donghaensis TaxID=414778 RepID=A0A1C7ELS0_9BACL|nr:thiamine-phosphate diphosphorylase [Planococcus donghaensis]
MGSRNSETKDPFTILEEALQGGITHFQLREKGSGALTGYALRNFALRCQQVCQNYSVPFIVNDDVELACSIDADGVHVGQDDETAFQVRQLIGEEKLLGVSVHSVEEARLAIQAGADYVGMGPVFGTTSKADAKKPAGVEEIKAVKREYPQLPIVGIGGIIPENADQVWRAGVSGVAVISAIANAKDVVEQVKAFQLSCKVGIGR